MITQRPTNTSMMHLGQILPLPTIDRLLEPPGRRTVADAVRDIDVNTARHREVRAWMIEHGRVPYPVHIAPAKVVLNSYANMRQEILALDDELGGCLLGNGNRRVAIAHELGWSHILTTPDVFRSGPEYAHLVGRRPIVFEPASKEEAIELYRSSRQPGLSMERWMKWATEQFRARGLGHLIE
jgi:hypothetical protein